MARREKPEFNDTPLPPPATTVEGREAQLVNMAMNLAEQRMHQGIASSQEVVHFLKLGSVINRAQVEKIHHENEVLKARVVEMEQRGSSEATYKAALRAFRGYSGEDVEDDQEHEQYG